MTAPNPDAQLPTSDRSIPEPVYQAFASSAETTFRELVQLETTVVPVTLATPDDLDSVIQDHGTPSDRDRVLIRAVLELQQPTAGLLNLVATTRTLRLLAQHYLPPESTISEEIIEDIAAEFANVIAGQAKTALKGTAFHFQLSTPTAQMNSDRAQIWKDLMSEFTVASATATPATISALLVQSELGSFLLTIRLTPCEQ